MRKTTLLLFLGMLCTLSSFGQVQIGDGTNQSQNLPFEPFYGYSYAQSIYLSSEINASGDITGIQWYFSGTSALPDSQSLVIYVGHTSENSYDSTTDWTPISELTQVYSGGIDVSAGVGWTSITFDTPFTYNGTDNLVIAVDENMASYDSSGDDFYNTNVGAQRSIGYYSDSTNPDPASPPVTGFNLFNSNYVPNIILEGIVQTCPVPSEIYTSNETPTTADVYWQAGSTETEWEVIYGETGFDPMIEGMTVADDDGILGVELTGLTPQVQYDVYVKAVCDVDDESSWTGPYTFGDYTALEVSGGYNEDVIANGIGDPATTTTSLVDNDSFAYLSVDYQFSATDSPAGFGLPLDGNLSEGPTAGLNYQLEDYSANNVLRMDTAGETNGGTITFNNTQTASNLYIAATSGSGASVLAGTITFDDNTTQDIPNTSVSDWYGGPDNVTIISGLGRVNVTNGNTESNSSNPRIYQLEISIDSSNYSKVISSVDLYKESGDGVINVFGASIQFAPNCAEPTDLVAENITSDAADISWMEGNTETEWEILYGEQGFDTETEGMTIQDNDGTLGESLTGLSSNTPYDVYVKSICGTDNESIWAGPLTFTTLCDEYGDFAEYFDTTEATNIPDCWSRIDDSSSIYAVVEVRESTTSYTEPNHMVMYNSGDGDFEGYLVTPELTALPNGTHQIRFYARNTGGQLEIGTMTDPTDATTYTAVEAIETTGDYEEYFVNFDAPTTDSYVVFKSTFEGTYDYLYIDNVVWQPIPTCPQPTDLYVNNISDTGADVYWTAGISETEWEILYGEEGFDMQTEGMTLSDTDGTIGESLSALAANTPYEVYVKAICGTDDESTWAGPISFTTECTPFTPDYLEEFDSYLPDCWSEAGAGNPTTGPQDLGTSLWTADDFLNTGDNSSVNINLYTDNREDWLISPLFDLSGGEYELVYTAAITDFNNSNAPEGNGMGSDDEVQVLISQDNGMTWENLVTYNQDNYPSNVGDLEVVNLAAYTGTVKFAFWATDGTVDDSEDYDFFIDDFEIRTPPSCPQPTDLVVESVSLTSAEISWEAGGEEDEWFVIYGEPEFDPLTEGSTEFVTGTPETTLFELAEETNYEFYVVAVCSALDTSFITGPSSFFTGYCESVPTSNDGTGFTTLELQSTVFTSGGDITYENFTDTPVTAAQGETVSIEVDLNTGTFGYDYHYNVWVDLNDNLEFEESELMVSGETVGDPDEIFDASFTLPADAIIGNHRLRIAVADTGQSTPNPCYSGSYGNTADFTLNVIDFCEAPTDVVVTNITETTAEVSWTDNAGTMEWEVFYVEEGLDWETEGMSVLDNDGELGVTLTDLDPNTTYEVYVVANCSVDNSSEMSTIETFTTLQEPCEAPTDVVFANITETTAEVSWTDNAGTMEWEVFYVEEGLDWETDGMSVLDNDGELGVTLTDLEPDTEYNVYVVAICSEDNESEASEEESFTTDEELSVLNSAFEGFSYYPNPVKTNLHLEATKSSIETVTVYDLLGKKVFTQKYNTLSADLNLSNLESGSYVVVVNINNQSKTIRFIKE